MLALDLFVNGLIIGLFYALMAVGLTMIFGILKIVNFAHGEFFMVGAFLAYQLFVSFGFDPLLSILFVAPALFVIGAIIYLSTIRYVLKAPELNQMLLTFGISIILQNLALLIWGGDPRTISNVPYRSIGYHVAGINIGLVPLGSFVISIVLVLALYLVLARSSLSLSLGTAKLCISSNPASSCRFESGFTPRL